MVAQAKQRSSKLAGRHDMKATITEDDRNFQRTRPLNTNMYPKCHLSTISGWFHLHRHGCRRSSVREEIRHKIGDACCSIADEFMT
jgi:hypothetical protein